MLSHSQQPRSVVIGGREWGKVYYPLEGPAEYVTERSPSNLFRSIPCKTHRGNCAGFTIRSTVVSMIESWGCFLVKVRFHFNGVKGKCQTIWITSTAKLKEAPRTMDSEGYLQYSLSLHEWVKVEG